jgi:hypothetical protein
MYDLLVVLARNDILSENVEKIKLIIDSEFNWNIFMTICFKQKVAGLIYRNFVNLGISDLIPFSNYHILKQFYNGNYGRNLIIFELLDHIIEKFKQNNIDVRPLKGSVLIPLIYGDLGSRVMNDIDLFFNKDDECKIYEILTEDGYIQGMYSRDKKEIIPIEYKEKILWKIKMFNLPPFIKTISSKYLDSLSLDFTHGFSYFSENNNYNDVLSKGEVVGKYYTLDKFDFFIHLCAHLHKEASNEVWIERGQGINLIKYCDVREFFLKKIFESDYDKLIERAYAINAIKPLYYAIYYTNMIYQDIQMNNFINKIKIDDKEYFNEIYRQGSKVVSYRNQSLAKMLTNIE